MRQFKFGQILGILSLTLIFSRCGDGGKARYELEPLTSDTAVALLEKSANNPAQTEVVLERVKASPAVGQSFWRQIEEKNLVARLPKNLQEKLLALHSKSCDEKDFDEFAQLILTLGYHYGFIVGELRRCSTALSPQRVLQFILQIRQQSEERKQRIAARLAQQVAQEAAAQQEVQEPNEELHHFWRWNGSLPMMSVQQARIPTLPSDAGQASQNIDRTMDRTEELVSPQELSQFLAMEILNDKERNESWDLTICFLTLDNLRTLHQELVALEQQAIADHYLEKYNSCAATPF